MSPSKKKKPKNHRQKPVRSSLRPYMIVIGILAIGFTGYIGYRASISEQKLFSVSILALFAGLVFESIRIAESWEDVVDKFIGTYVLSLLCFWPAKHENPYNFERHIELWPYYFIAAFTFAATIFDKDRITAKLTEGITLLLSLSLIYWVLDYGFLNIHNWVMLSSIAVLLLFSAISILNAFTYLKLSDRTRLFLSIWSTIIMVAFAIDNAIRVFHNQDIEATRYLSQGLYIGFQYFLLGVSAVYIVQNVVMLLRFLPDKNRDYKEQLSEVVDDHLTRYSDEQVSIKHSLFCMLYAVTLFALNYVFHFLPRHTMIWLVLFSFPLILYLIKKLTGTRKDADTVEPE